MAGDLHYNLGQSRVPPENLFPHWKLKFVYKCLKVFARQFRMIYCTAVQGRYFRTGELCRN